LATFTTQEEVRQLHPIGTAVAHRAKRRDERADHWRIATGWGLGFVVLGLAVELAQRLR
jgi:hypothetical protein